MYALYTTQVLELLRCLYMTHWKELSADEVNNSTAVERWSEVWVQPVLEVITSHSTSTNHRSRLCDVRPACFLLLRLTVIKALEVSTFIFRHLQGNHHRVTN